jgi:hypothetical protein
MLTVVFHIFHFILFPQFLSLSLSLSFPAALSSSFSFFLLLSRFAATKQARAEC